MCRLELQKLMVSNCCRAFSSCVLKNWASTYFSFPRGGCQKLSFVPKSGRPFILFFPGVGVRNLVSCPQVGVHLFLSFFPGVGVRNLVSCPKVGVLVTNHCVPFPLSLVSWVCLVCFFSDLFALSHRSIDRLSRNKKDPVTQVVQSSANKEKKRNKKTSKTRHHGFLENGLHPDRVRMVSLDCDFCCRLWGLVRRRCCKAKLEESFFPGGG